MYASIMHVYLRHDRHPIYFFDTPGLTPIDRYSFKKLFKIPVGYEFTLIMRDRDYSEL